MPSKKYHYHGKKIGFKQIIKQFGISKDALIKAISRNELTPLPWTPPLYFEYEAVQAFFEKTDNL